MKINFMENIYGIELIRDLDFNKKCNLIYAGNGTMKTSFTKSISRIINGEVPEELVYRLSPRYDITIFEVKHTENNFFEQNNVICYGHNFLEAEILKLDSLPVLLIDENLLKEYKQLKEYQKDNLKDLFDILAITFILKKLDYNKIFNYLKIIYNMNIKEINDVINIFNDKLLKSESYFSEKKKSKEILNLLLNPKLDKIKESTELEKYVEHINKKKDTIYVDDNFTISQLENLKKALTKNFFKKGNYLVLLSNEKKYKEIKSLEELEEILLIENNKIFETTETKEKFQLLEKICNANKDTREFINLINNYEHRWVLEYLTKKDFLIQYFESFLTEQKELIKIIINKNLEIQTKVKIFFTKIDEKYNETEWNKILKDFNNRIKLPFTVEIKNKTNIMLDGETTPVINFKYKNNFKEVTIPKEENNHLSSGEKKALFFLTLLYKVNILLKNSEFKEKGILLILDDIVESFDYQNKYAVLNYLYEFLFTDDKYGKNNKLIILSHNFDFIRSCQYHFGKNTKTILFSKIQGKLQYKDFFECSYGSIKDNQDNSMIVFNEWKNDINSKKGKLNDITDFYSLIALIPVIRNVNILLKINDDSNFLNLIMHMQKYDNNYSDVIEWEQLNEEFQIFKLEKIIILNKEYIKVFKTIEKACQKIVLDIKEHNYEQNIYEILKYKIILAYGIRIKLEEKMIQILHDNKIEVDWEQKIITTQMLHSQLRKLSKKKKSVYDGKLRRIVVRALTLINEVVHINSFMYEPLIDVDLTNLSSLYDELINLNI